MLQTIECYLDLFREGKISKEKTLKILMCHFSKLVSNQCRDKNDTCLFHVLNKKIHTPEEKTLIQS